MEGGKDWWLQITDAIDHVEFLVLVMTPAALGSDYVRREWRYARQQGRCVIPVIGAKGIDFDSLPGCMRRAHFVRPRRAREWRRFVRTLEAPCKATHAPFMVEIYQRFSSSARASSIRSLASLLDQTQRGAGRDHRRAPAAPAATARPRSPARSATTRPSRTPIDDGILWVTLGENPGDLGGRVADLI